jgi:hypothetical protein
MKFKFFCRGNHWQVKGEQLILATPMKIDKQRSQQLIKVLEEQIRQQIYTEIMALPIPRTLMVKGGIEHIAPTVKQICAESVLKRHLTATLDQKENKSNP